MIGVSSPFCTVEFVAKRVRSRRIQNIGGGGGVVVVVHCSSTSSNSKNKMMECMKLGFCGKHNSKKVKEESVSGGEGGGREMWEATEATEAQHYPEHLVVMVNGIIGSAEDWKYAAKKLIEKLPDKVIVHRSERNSSRLTFDGVDLMGERLAEEVLSVVRRRPGVQKISFVAHSLGGLIARYAIGRLYDTCSDSKSSILNGSNDVNSNIPGQYREQLLGRIAGLEPINFITFATPHLGSRGHKQLPFLCGLPFLERRAPQTAHWIAGRTGKHLFLTDNDDGKPPLLLRMANDCDDLKFLSALRAFKRRVVYSNVNYDHMVGWRTSSIRRQHELPQSHLLAKYEKYPHIVHIERESTNEIHKEASSHVRAQTVEMEEEMIKGLRQMSWERVDVSFRKSRQRYVAHNTIQVNTYWMNSDGVDVIFHMIDNFLL